MRNSCSASAPPPPALDAIPDLARRGRRQVSRRFPSRAAIEGRSRRGGGGGARAICFSGVPGYPASARGGHGRAALADREGAANAGRPARGRDGRRAQRLRLGLPLRTGGSPLNLASAASPSPRGWHAGSTPRHIKARSTPARSGSSRAASTSPIPPRTSNCSSAIATDGLLVAEQPPGIEPRARHFPLSQPDHRGAGAGRGGDRGGPQIRFANHRALCRRLWPRGAGRAGFAARPARAGVATC